MKDNYFGKLKKGLKRAVLIGGIASSIAFSGCDVSNSYDAPTPKNHSPKAILSIKTKELPYPPTEGYALEAIIKVDGEDKDGKEDIVKYKLYIDSTGLMKTPSGKIEEIIEQDPIEVTRTYVGIGKVTVIGYCYDKQGAGGRDDSVMSLY